MTINMASSGLWKVLAYVALPSAISSALYPICYITLVAPAICTILVSNIFHTLQYLTLILMPMVLLDQKGHFAPHLDDLDQMNAVVALAMLFALCNADASGNGIT